MFPDDRSAELRLEDLESNAMSLACLLRPRPQPRRLRDAYEATQKAKASAFNSTPTFFINARRYDGPGMMFPSPTRCSALGNRVRRPH